MDGSTSSHSPNAPAPDSPLAALSREDLEAQITALAGQLNAATYRWLMLIAEFDRRKAWSDAALASCARWLNFKVGLNLDAAREKVRVAHALPRAWTVPEPRISATMPYAIGMALHGRSSRSRVGYANHLRRSLMDRDSARGPSGADEWFSPLLSVRQP